MNIAVQAMLGSDGINAPAAKQQFMMGLDDAEMEEMDRTGLAQEDNDGEDGIQDADEAEQIINNTYRNPVVKLRKGITKIRYKKLLFKILFNVSNRP